MIRCIVLGVVCPLTLALLAGDAPAGKAAGKPSAALMKVRAVRAALNESIDLTGFNREAMTLKEALGVLQDQLNQRYRAGDVLPILVDEAAFKAENPDAPDIYDTEVKFPPFPRQMTVLAALRVILSKVATNNATFLVRGEGYIWVTTYERAALAARLGERVEHRFTRVPLAEALNTLAEERGIPVVVDARLAWRTKAVVTADLSTGVSLASALYILADMGGLRGVATADLLYFTTPENAARLLRESGGNMVPLLPGAIAPPNRNPKEI